ncbi:triose-phosphate isomerase [Microaerobacter geothermalis]|uniref:triose-phosphate isomerase n=1 Tax=Microaerobacter geothermalis TaxID=674972 RepID=UPI001F40598D|nr:triose-phosphate isomerase [Microaerobacter geothermalis]MCF6093619.1 triose-phosphate isomerase [Microaerobacter geothermalis]
MRKPIIAANWKMYKTHDEAKAFLQEIDGLVAADGEIDTVLCAPFTALCTLSEMAKERPVSLGAQNMHWEDEGAFTGEISGQMLSALGIQYVILGHSERRQMFGEMDDMVNKKVLAAFRHGLTPIVCVGETIKQREQGETQKILKKQTERAIEGLSSDQVKQMVIAYEPVWAIGTGKTSSPEDANDDIGFIRRVVADQYDQVVANEVRIQYGGSVKPENIASFMAQPEIDGALVGGASLKPESFLQLLEKAIQYTK